MARPMIPHRLTPEQRRIVEHPMEPLRIVAGAGTGKTTTIVLRLVRAVERGLAPERALGITFTNKAAGELADRLRTHLPELAAAGREVPVTTYHGFAASLLQEFGALVGVERDTAIIGPGYRRQLLDEALAATRGRALDLTNRPARIAQADLLARRLDEHLRTVDELVAIAPSPSERTQVWLERLDLADVVAAYTAAKRRLGVLDYGDLVRLAHELVTAHPHIADRVADRYRLVLLDEYQDTDPGQRRLLQHLFGDGFPVTAVGDPDQTIYEWRGASLENFASFPRHFPRADGSPAETRALTLGRRCDVAIVGLAAAIQERIASPEPVPSLRPGPGAGPGAIDVAWLRTSRDEASWLARRLRGLHETGTPWREMAVLFRKSRHMAPVREALEADGIPVEVAALGGLLDVPAVVDLLAWLRILADPHDSASLARILLGGPYRLGLADLLPLHHRAEANRRRGGEAATTPARSLLETIDRLEEVEDLSTEARARLTEFREIYRTLLPAAQSSTLVDLCRQVLRITDTWTDVASLPPGAAVSTRLDLHRFLDLVESWSPLRGRPSLDGFLAYLQSLEEGADGTELDTATVSREDAVSLLTVHRAKGLEWDVVALPALTEGTFPSRPSGLDDPDTSPAALPDELRLDPLPTAGDGRRDTLRRRHMDQEWRTAYVAVTRARHLVLASGSWWEAGRLRPHRPSPLFELIAAAPEAQLAALVEEPGERPTPIPISSPVAAPDPLFPDGWRAGIRAAIWGNPPRSRTEDEEARARALERELRSEIAAIADAAPRDAVGETTVSAGGLVTLAACPKRFRFAEIDGLPRRPGPWRRRGVDIHRRIELHLLGGLPTTAVEDAAETLAGGGDRTLQGDPFETFLRSRFATTRPLLVEAPVDAPLGPLRIRGRIDAVYPTADGSWELVDFKTGTASNRPERWIQLDAYAVAVDAGALGSPPPGPLRLTFAWLGGDAPVEEQRVADASYLATARVRLEELAERAIAGPFEARPGPHCTACDFVTFCAEGRARPDAGLSEPSRPRRRAPA